MVRRLMLNTVCWITSGALLLATASAQVDPPAVPQEIRQGGYVEKVDPSVDYRDRVPRIPPREPADSLRSFHLPPGFRIEQVAAEPLLADPVDLAFDDNGRLFVAEMIPYAEGGTSQFGSPEGRISMLEDTDGDGRFDRSQVFADKLVWPTGLACFDGGLFVVAAPDLWYFKDTDGDGRADVRELVVTGFETSNPNALPNSLRWGLDNRLHGTTSTAGGLLQAVRWERQHGTAAERVQSRGRDFSLDPRTESGGGQFGTTFDAWGRKFQSSNSNPCDMVMYEDRYIARNPTLAAPAPRINIWKSGAAVYRTSPPEPWREVRIEMRVAGAFSGPVEGGGKSTGYFTGACGLMVYLGDAWPEEFGGNGFVCEGSGNLCVRMRLEPDGVGFAAHRTETGRDFLTSDEIWFRPIQFTNGPDGNLYLADMYRELYEHPDAVPPSVKKHLDLTAGKDRGRIYRIVHRPFRQPPPAKLDAMTTRQLVDLLAHPNFWHRNTASRLLYERQDGQAVPWLEELVAGSASPLGRMHALAALDGLDALTPEAVLAGLSDDHPRVREHAVRLSEQVQQDAPAVRARLYSLVADPDLRVRYQLAFTLGEVPGLPSTEALADIARRDAADPWLRLAVLSSCTGRAGPLFSLLAKDADWRASDAARDLLGQLAEQAGLQDRADQVADVLGSLETFGPTETALSKAVVSGLTKGLAGSKSPLLARLSADGSSRAGSLLAEMIAQSQTTAMDEDQPEAVRVQAVRSLATASFQVAQDILPGLLAARQPAPVQVAAVQTLGRFQEPEVAGLIVDAWPGFSPSVRGEAAEALFARPERIRTLLTAVEQRVIQPNQLDPARVAFLLKHPDTAIRQAAEQLLGGVKLARREDAVAAYRDVLELTGDRQRGKAVFKRDCSACHRLEEVGYDLGLPLLAIRNRGREGILIHVLDPNREVNPAYANYIAITIDGRSITGMIAAETATSITLSRGEGQTETVLRKNIDEMVNTGLSLMAEGLEKQLSKQDMADVIEYLMAVEP
jgi:putative membrane-bound dehydrogenase-like protein